MVFFFSLDPFLRKIIDYIPDLLKTFRYIVSKYKNNIVSFIQKIKHQIWTSWRKHRKLPKKELRQVKWHALLCTISTITEIPSSDTVELSLSDNGNIPVICKFCKNCTFSKNDKVPSFLELDSNTKSVHWFSITSSV